MKRNSYPMIRLFDPPLRKRRAQSPDPDPRELVYPDLSRVVFWFFLLMLLLVLAAQCLRTEPATERTTQIQNPKSKIQNH